MIKLTLYKYEGACNSSNNECLPYIQIEVMYRIILLCMKFLWHINLSVDVILGHKKCLGYVGKACCVDWEDRATFWWACCCFLLDPSSDTCAIVLRDHHHKYPIGNIFNVWSTKTTPTYLLCFFFLFVLGSYCLFLASNTATTQYIILNMFTKHDSVLSCFICTILGWL